MSRKENWENFNLHPMGGGQVSQLRDEVIYDQHIENSFYFA